MPYPKKDIDQPPRPLLSVRIPYNFKTFLVNAAAQRGLTLAGIVIRVIEYYKGRKDIDN